MKKFYSLYGLTLAGLFFSIACTPSLKVTTDYDKAANFKQYKTFALDLVDEKNQSISQLNKDRIVNSVKSEMTKKGFQENSAPDLLVHVTTILKDKQSVTANTNYYGYGGAYRPYGWSGGGSGYTTYNVEEYKDGSLIIEIVDAKTQKLIWEGIGNKEIDKPASDLDKAIAEAVATIMKNFPPGTGAK